MGEREVERIGYVAGGVAIALGLLGLVGGFAVLYPQAVKELHDEITLVRDNHAMQWNAAILNAWEQSEDFANQRRPLLAMESLDRDPQNAQALARIRELVSRYRELGFAAISFRTRSGVEVVRSGKFTPFLLLTAKLHLPSKSMLLWNGRYVVHTRVDMVLDSRVIGSMESERELDVSPDSESHADLVRFGDTLDFGICAANGTHSMNCFPFLSTDDRVLRNLPDRVNGRFLPMHYALAGDTGVAQLQDYRGHEVIAAYQPIGNLGLGYVMKVDADQFYGPIAHRVTPLLYLVPVLALGTVLLLRVQMIPFVRHMAESERRFRSTFAHAPIGMMIAEASIRGGFLEVNDPLCAFLGYGREELLRLSLRDVIHPDDLQNTEDGFRRLLRGESLSYRVETRFLHKDGRNRWAQLSVSSFSSPGRSQPMLILQIENIEERKRAEKELASAKERLELAMRASSLSIWECSIRDQTVVLDAHWAEIVGDPPGSVVTTPARLAQRIHPDDVERMTKDAVAIIHGAANAFQQEFRFRDAAGQWKWILCSGKINERDDKGLALRAVGTNRDITGRKVEEEKIHHWAYFDRLTNLPNRRLLDDRLQKSIALAQRKRSRLALLFIDLDKFKPVNDEYGHAAGDWLLRWAALRMQECVRQSDTVARLGGDEFAAVLPEIDTLDDAVNVAEKIREALARPFAMTDGTTLSISSSVGIALYPDHAQSARDLLRRGDEAMYEAKSAGRNAVHVFAPVEPG